MSFSTASPSAAVGVLDIGRVIGSTMRIMRTRFWDLSLIALPWVIVPQVIASSIPNLPFAAANLFSLPSLVFDSAATFIGYNVLIDGPRLGFVKAHAKAFERFGSFFLSRIIANIGTGLATVLLIVPGVIVMIGWMVSTPAVVIEGKTAVDALSRSWELTKGSRWRLAGLLGILVLTMLGVLAVLAILAFLISFAAGVAMTAGGQNPSVDASGDIAGFVASPLLIYAFSLLTAAGWTAVYVELRTMREGPLDSQIARTFD